MCIEISRPIYTFQDVSRLSIPRCLVDLENASLLKWRYEKKCSPEF